MIILVIFYFLAGALSFFYIKTDKKKAGTDTAGTIVVLSAANRYITKYRLKYALKVWRGNGEIQPIAVCGKNLHRYMKDYLESRGATKIIVQDMSTNTLEDAQYLVKLLKNQCLESIVLVTSLSHQRRAYKTFRKIFKNGIANRPAWNELFSLYSPLLPTGWVATSVNLYKDIKHRSKT
ncbi:MAG: YdcF family protein [Patescibacteria group bacterium]